MKKYLIDDLTLKRFVQKITSSPDGSQITAVVKQTENERLVSFWHIMNFFLYYIFQDECIGQGNSIIQKTTQRRKIPKICKEKKTWPKGQTQTNKEKQAQIRKRIRNRRLRRPIRRYRSQTNQLLRTIRKSTNQRTRIRSIRIR